MAKDKTGRPVDTPIGSGVNVTGQDLEKRAMIFPPGFIDEIVLKGGDEYVKAEDLKTIINAVVEILRVELQQIKLHLASMSDENITDKDTKN